MGPERRRLLILVALLVVVAGAAVYLIWPQPSASPAATSNPKGGHAADSGRAATPSVPDVHLKELDGERPKPSEDARDLFRFKPKAPPPEPAAPPRAQAPFVPITPIGPPATSGPAPIPLKFIAVVETKPPETPRKIAVLSDGRGGPSIYGSEGEVVLGRYRILHIGAESIEMSYLDGRGRQTIRLSGS